MILVRSLAEFTIIFFTTKTKTLNNIDSQTLLLASTGEGSCNHSVTPRRHSVKEGTGPYDKSWA
jgi:hypothetical protein